MCPNSDNIEYSSLGTHILAQKTWPENAVWILQLDDVQQQLCVLVIRNVISPPIHAVQ